MRDAIEDVLRFQPEWSSDYTPAMAGVRASLGPVLSGHRVSGPRHMEVA